MRRIFISIHECGMPRYASAEADSAGTVLTFSSESETAIPARLVELKCYSREISLRSNLLMAWHVRRKQQLLLSAPIMGFVFE
jgi:hypothetical protein